MQTKKIRIGIVGCGAIGSGIAHFVQKDLKKYCRISGIHDIDGIKAATLDKGLSLKNVRKRSLDTLIKDCDCMIEAVNAPNIQKIIRQAVMARKDVLAMSSGQLLNAPSLFQLARKNRSRILIPTGAIAGIDAIKAASLVDIDQITLTTRKPLTGFAGNPYIEQKNIDLTKIKKETVLFEGSVDEAVRHFPRNINVAATIALASGAKDKLRIQIVTSPKIKSNSHTIEMTGRFGRMVTQTENVISPDNPKTSYLAVLSGCQTLKQYCEGVFIGT